MIDDKKLPLLTTNDHRAGKSLNVVWQVGKPVYCSASGKQEVSLRVWHEKLFNCSFKQSDICDEKINEYHGSVQGET